MKTERLGAVSAAGESKTAVQCSIDEMVRALERGDRQPLLEEYMYIGTVPFFRYYLENTVKYLGKNAAREYEAGLHRLGIDITEKEPARHPFLTDYYTWMIREKQADLFEDFLYAVLIMPMQVVRARRQCAPMQAVRAKRQCIKKEPAGFMNIPDSSEDESLPFK